MSDRVSCWYFRRCVLVGSSNNADVDFKNWYFGCDGQQRALRDSEATTFCEQEPAVGFASVFLRGYRNYVVLISWNDNVLGVTFSDARATGNTALSSPCWDLLALMRRVVNYHSSWVGKRQVELFDASGIRMWCKDERPSAVVQCLMHRICILSCAVSLAVSVALQWLIVAPTSKPPARSHGISSGHNHPPTSIQVTATEDWEKLNQHPPAAATEDWEQLNQHPPAAPNRGYATPHRTTKEELQQGNISWLTKEPLAQYAMQMQ
ncbi:hypothetical protein F511_18532 [Dorcoceras hygrometricum]|uniref:Uncharacterized protein n=1 Tax=Dorcoceras hygrometricum TaxID=472368 RepID=A0A2Z7AKN4_9LAMI|nr:hypothetical protein F511_18532 [Dorcoceras hygrometricum]